MNDGQVVDTDEEKVVKKTVWRLSHKCGKCQFTVVIELESDNLSDAYEEFESLMEGMLEDDEPSEWCGIRYSVSDGHLAGMLQSFEIKPGKRR